MEYYIVYETTNSVNQKKYRGMHITNDLDDGYLGSGRALVRAIKKYGIENFERVILEFSSSYEELLEAERKWVDREWVDRTDTYNMILGGMGDWSYVNRMGFGLIGAARGLAEALKRRKCKYTNGEEIRFFLSDEVPSGWIRYQKPRRLGVGTGTHGRKWYHDPITNKRAAFLADEIPPDGWILGQGKKKKEKCFWFTDGTCEGQYTLDDFPEGWVRGRIKKCYRCSTKNTRTVVRFP